MNDVQYVPIDDVIPYENNPRNNDAAVDAVAASIDEFGFQQPLVCDRDMVLVVGHTRLKAAKLLGYTQVPVVVASELTDEQIRAYRLADNKTAERATWDFELLSDELEAITTIDMSQFDFDVSEQLESIGDDSEQDEHGSLEEMFAFVPFSIIDTTAGKWPQRKRDWLATGIRSELGRGDELLYGINPVKYMGNNSRLSNQTSVFDPVLCELDYLWFTNEGDSVLDPFAGGSVRGIVAGMMGRRYTGIDLRSEQVEENISQACELSVDGARWICGDSLEADGILGDAMFDHVFTCPPYGDLEVYSEDERDISNMSTDDFNSAYAEIIRIAAGHLKDDRFMTIVVGNYRGRHGSLQDLSGITVRAAESAGLRYYNDCILATAIGTLPIRTGSQFSKTRKVGRRHQYVLNFVKGDDRNATSRLDEIAVPDFEQFIDEEAQS